MDIKLHKNVLFDAWIIIMDILIVLISAFLSYKFISLWKPVEPIGKVPMLFSIGCTIFMLYTYDFYTKMIRRKYEIILSIIITVVVTTIVMIITNFLFLHKSLRIESAYFGVMPFFLLVFLTFWKSILLKIVKRVEGVSKLLIIESKDVSNTLARKVKYSYLELYESWYVEIDVNDCDEIAETIAKFDDYESVFISPDIPDSVRAVFISEAVSKRKEIYILPDLYNISVMKNETVHFEDTPALRIKPFGLTTMQKVIKRAMDIVVSVIGIVVTSPVMLISAIAIKIDSDGPVIYKQERLTYDEKPFMVYKFRTMFKDAEIKTGATLATDNDPRVTKVGRVLRSLRIDELPQFFNIFMGSMSVVGPRPERPVFVKQFKAEIPNYDKRFHAKAGLTGFAQVYARYDTTAKDKTLYDLLYIKDYSFWFDIKLLLLTIKIIFMKESSDGVGSRPDYTNIDSKGSEE